MVCLGRASGAIALLLAAGACEVHPERAPCRRDGDCADEELCYEDALCLPVAAARQLGAPVGEECGVRAGREVGCHPFETCLRGFCDGPPEFAGAEVAVTAGPDAVRVTWSHAHDVTPEEAIAYDVFVALEDALMDWGSPVQTVIGATEATVAGLPGNRRHRFAVRAVDEFLQADGNFHEVTAVPGCVDYSAQIQPILDESCIGCHMGPAAPRGLVLESHEGMVAGSDLRRVLVPCVPGESYLFRKISESVPPIGARMPFDGPYLMSDQIALIEQWMAQGAGATCPLDAELCANTSPPAFAGLTEARLIDPSQAELCWSAAADDVTPPEAIVYEIYEGAGPGAQDFDRLPLFTTEPGALCATLSGRVPGELDCFVVRARDAAGNRDRNFTEMCLAVPDAPCIEFRTVIQPLFEQRCVHCHGGPRPFRDQSFESYASTLARGAAIISRCRPEDSLLYLKVYEEFPPVGDRMPADGPPWLSPAQIEAIRRWIAEGARETCADPPPC